MRLRPNVNAESGGKKGSCRTTRGEALQNGIPFPRRSTPVGTGHVVDPAGNGDLVRLNHGGWSSGFKLPAASPFSFAVRISVMAIAL